MFQKFGFPLSSVQVFWLLLEGSFLRFRSLVEESGKVRDGAVEVSGCLAVVLHEWLGVSHILSEVLVSWEHGLVQGGLGALQSKLVAEFLTSHMKLFLIQSLEGMFITSILLSKDDGKAFLLHHFELPALHLGQATVEDRGGKL